MRTFRGVAVAFAVLVTAGSVLAQNDGPERGGPRGGGRGGFGGGGGFGRGMMDRGYLGLLRMDEVQDELKVSEEQETKIADAGEAMRDGQRPPGGGIGNFRDLSDEEREAAIAKMREAMAAREQEVRSKLAEILDDTQMKRLRGLWVQRVGVLAALSDEAIATELKLSEDQAKAVATQQEEQRGQFGFGGGRRRGEGGPPPGAGGGEGGNPFERFQQMRKEADEKALGLLTDDQKTAFAEIKGADFEFPRPEFGGFRGGRGRGEGDGDGPPRRRGGPNRDAA